MVTLLLGLPWFVFSLAVVSMVTGLAVPGSNAAAWTAMGVFVASGVLVFVRVTEDVLARVVLRLRRPTMVEQQRLGSVWGSVAAAAGVRGDKFQLWVQESHGENAFATAGHIVAVTRSSLMLPPNQLAVVLAHELGHHLGGHAWASLLTYWYSLPARLVARLLFWITFLFVAGVGAVASMFDRTGLMGSLFGLALRAFRCAWPVLATLALFSVFPPLVLMVAAPLVLAWFTGSARSGPMRLPRRSGTGSRC